MKKYGDADHGIPAMGIQQPLAELDQVSRENLRQIIRESFDDFSEQLGRHDLKGNGVLFLCDPAGTVICIYAYSGLNDEDLVLLQLEEGLSWEERNLGPNAVGACVKSPGLHFIKRHHHKIPRLQQYDSYALPIYDPRGNTVIAILGMISKSRNEHDQQFILKNAAFAYRACLAMNLEKKLKNRLNASYRQFEKEARQKDILFQIVRQFHSCNDAKSVLVELMNSIQNIYPRFQAELYISQDFQPTSFSFKPLHVNRREELCTRAFMEGRLLFERDEHKKECRIAVPLAGKQAVYGVIEIQGADFLDDSDLQFVSMLADSAGTAFENARLYEQSNMLIHELRLINEITSRLNQSLSLKDIFHFAAEELIRIFQADYGCILQLFDDADGKLVVQSGNIPELMRKSFPDDYGFSGMVIRSREPVIVSDYPNERKVESKLMEITRSRSLMAAPIIANGKAMGAVLLAHRSPHFFTYENFRLLRVLSGHIGLALTNARLHAEVRRMAITDHLTGLYVRHYLDEQIKNRQANDDLGSLILVDIDNFKKINDTFGHQIGDQVLKQVARVILSNIRDEDIAARWGGEELAIYLPRVSLNHALQIAERLRKAIIRETTPQVTISCGVAEWKQSDEKISVEHLFYRADMALYRAKNEGRNRVVIEGGNKR